MRMLRDMYGVVKAILGIAIVGKVDKWNASSSIINIPCEKCFLLWRCRTLSSRHTLQWKRRFLQTGSRISCLLAAHLNLPDRSAICPWQASDNWHTLRGASYLVDYFPSFQGVVSMKSMKPNSQTNRLRK